jgi:ParB-like chromosome segregation protein Spo0J
MEALIEICLITINKQPVEEDHVEEFVELLEAGRHLPPITVRKISDTEYRLVDGRHRLLARLRLGQTRVRARITL